MKVRVIDLPNIVDSVEFQRKCAEAVKSIQDAVNGGLNFEENIQSAIVTVEFTTADANTKASHGLGKTPTGYLLAGSTAAMNIYDGTGTNTDRDVYFRSDATGTARILIF